MPELARHLFSLEFYGAFLQRFDHKSRVNIQIYKMNIYKKILYLILNYGFTQNYDTKRLISPEREAELCFGGSNKFGQAYWIS